MLEEISRGTGHHPCRETGLCTCICGHQHDFTLDWYRPADIPIGELWRRYGLNSEQACYGKAKSLGLARRDGTPVRNNNGLHGGRWVDVGGVKRWEKL